MVFSQKEMMAKIKWSLMKMEKQSKVKFWLLETECMNPVRKTILGSRKLAINSFPSSHEGLQLEL